MSIHCRLSSVLGNKRIKMSELSRMANVSKTTLHFMYHDKLQKIDFGVLDRICSALDCTVADLIEYVKEGEAL